MPNHRAPLWAAARRHPITVYRQIATPVTMGEWGAAAHVILDAERRHQATWWRGLLGWPISRLFLITTIPFRTWCGVAGVIKLGPTHHRVALVGWLILLTTAAGLTLGIATLVNPTVTQTLVVGLGIWLFAGLRFGHGLAGIGATVQLWRWRRAQPGRWARLNMTWCNQPGVARPWLAALVAAHHHRGVGLTLICVPELVAYYRSIGFAPVGDTERAMVAMAAPAASN